MARPPLYGRLLEERVSASCRGKAEYKTLKHAQADAKGLWRRTREVVEPYHCKHCRCFHLGHHEHRSQPLKDR